jgi:hypothetical protein
MNEPVVVCEIGTLLIRVLPGGVYRGHPLRICRVSYIGVNSPGSIETHETRPALKAIAADSDQSSRIIRTHDGSSCIYM